jgi:hypothetical protein
MFKDIILTLVVVFFYILFFEKFGDVIFNNQPMCKKNSSIFVFLFLVSCLSIFGVKKKVFKINNKIIKNGVLYGGIGLILKRVFMYWGQMNDPMKLVVIGLFGLLFYIWIDENKNNNHKKSKKRKQKKYKRDDFDDIDDITEIG